MSNNKTVKVHMEVCHDKTFARYDVQSNPNDAWKDGATLLGGPETLNLPASRRKIYEQIVDAIYGYDCFSDTDLIYFKQAGAMYSLPNENIHVDINSTQHILFNTPLNLMFTAACTDDHDITFYSDVTSERIVRLVRYAMSINVHPTDGDPVGMHMVYMNGDHIVLNDVSSRSIQFNHVIRLINCKNFVSKITNGNLLLAFADIYHHNLDDDIIEISSLLPGVGNVIYDQFSKYSDGNVIEVNRIQNGSIYIGEYRPDVLDSVFVEFLIYEIEAILNAAK